MLVDKICDTSNNLFLFEVINAEKGFKFEVNFVLFQLTDFLHSIVIKGVHGTKSKCENIYKSKLN